MINILDENGIDTNKVNIHNKLAEDMKIISKKEIDGKIIPIDGELRYRGYLINDLVEGFVSDQRFGYEEIAYLLIFGELPTVPELENFRQLLGRYRTLPTNFTRDVIMKAPGRDMMNTLQRGVLTLYGYDERADDISLSNVLRQCLSLIATVPMMAVYGYHAYNHY